MAEQRQGKELEGMKVCVLVGPGYEDLEMWVPYLRLQEAGAQATLVGMSAAATYKSKRGCLEATAQAAARDLDPKDWDAVIIPGGWAPDKLRRDQGVLDLVRGIHDKGGIVGMICHAGHVGVSAGIVSGRKATGSTGIKDDLVNAGATWVDESAFQDGNLVWGRVVADIPAYCATLVAALAAYRASQASRD